MPASRRCQFGCEVVQRPTTNRVEACRSILRSAHSLVSS